MGGDGQNEGKREKGGGNGKKRGKDGREVSGKRRISWEVLSGPEKGIGRRGQVLCAGREKFRNAVTGGRGMHTESLLVFPASGI